MQIKNEDIDFYKEHYFRFDRANKKINDLISFCCGDNIEHFKSRIKSEKSTTAKLEKLGLDKTLENAAHNLTDIIGLRIVCRFLEDVYKVARKTRNIYKWTLGGHDYEKIYSDFYSSFDACFGRMFDK